VAEWIMAVILAQVRQLPRFMAAQQAGTWDFAPSEPLAGQTVAELRSGRLRAALDVTDPEPLPAGHPLWSAPGLLLTPHVAGATTDAVPRAMAVVRDQLARYAAGEPLLNIVGEQGY
jgi:phosphoglycerate dehydrogenase-like enzyme